MENCFETIKNLEIELTELSTRSNIQRLAALIHDDFMEVGCSGKTYNKADILRCLHENTNPCQLSNFSFKHLADDCILIHYQSISNSSKALRTSIWKKDHDIWQMLHHQGTVQK